jgi:hypothetical protein
MSDFTLKRGDLIEEPIRSSRRRVRTDIGLIDPLHVFLGGLFAF